MRPLENKVLLHMVADMLSAGLWKVLSGPLDRLFALCGATIYCVLKSYINGDFKDVSVNSPTFNEAYKEIITYITDTVGGSVALRERFDMVQRDLI